MECTSSEQSESSSSGTSASVLVSCNSKKKWHNYQSQVDGTAEPPSHSYCPTSGKI